jgi:formylglycine-generating enzyme required for sulfatase activity
LSKNEGLETCYRISENNVVWSNPACEGWRLPTEAEWEYAARGGEKHPFSGGDDAGEVAWYVDNGSGGVNPVAQKSSNAFGLHDMSGNVFEWNWDWFDGYANLSLNDPTGPSVGAFRVRRGGSWYDDKHACRVSDRYGSNPDYRSDHVGIRLFRLFRQP